MKIRSRRTLSVLIFIGGITFFTGCSESADEILTLMIRIQQLFKIQAAPPVLTRIPGCRWIQKQT